MTLISHLPSGRRQHVEARLRGNLMAWLTTVRPKGQPDSVPVWFLLQDDGTILMYSEPDKLKLRNIEHNAQVALGLDVTDLGRDIIRVTGTAECPPGYPSAVEVPAFVAKYTERIGAVFGTVADYSKAYSQAIVITPTRLYA